MSFPVEIGTRTINNGSSNRDTVTFSHTVPVFTSCLVLVIGIEGAENMTTPVPSFNGSDFSQRVASSNSGNNADSRTLLYTLDSPDITTGDIVVNWDGNVNPSFVTAINYKNTSPWSGNSTNSRLEQSPNTATTIDTTLTGMLDTSLAFFACAFQGNDGAPVSSSPGTEIYEDTTGGSSAGDFTHSAASHTVASGSSSNTFTFSVSDQSSIAAMELLASVPIADSLPIFPRKVMFDANANLRR